MTEKFVEEVIRSEEMTLSQVIWRFLRRQPRGYLERVLAFNQDLSLTQPYLPVGMVLRLPVEDIADKKPSDTIRLWD